MKPEACSEWYQLFGKGYWDKTTMVEISLKFYYTSNFIDAIGGHDKLEAHLENTLGIANQGFRNSEASRMESSLLIRQVSLCHVFYSFGKIAYLLNISLMETVS